MDLKPFVGKMVTVILDPKVSIPGLDFFATVQDREAQYNMVFPQVFTPHPERAMFPEGNVILNAMVVSVDKGAADLRYTPWATAGMRGPAFDVRILEADVQLVLRCVAAPPEAEIEAVRREAERKQMEAANQPTSLVGQPRVTTGF